MGLSLFRSFGGGIGNPLRGQCSRHGVYLPVKAQLTNLSFIFSVCKSRVDRAGMGCFSSLRFQSYLTVFLTNQVDFFLSVSFSRFEEDISTVWWVLLSLSAKFSQSKKLSTRPLSTCEGRWQSCCFFLYPARAERPRQYLGFQFFLSISGSWDCCIRSIRDFYVCSAHPLRVFFIDTIIRGGREKHPSRGGGFLSSEVG